MKRIFKKFILCALLLVAVFGMLVSCAQDVPDTKETDSKTEETTVPPPEDEDPIKRTEVWSPIEINLQSTVAYENPYVATEIDAVFTHADGTAITLPGFWKEGEIWAVRFSPTKEGEWSYKVTCKDEANTGLFGEGVILADAATADTELAKHGFVMVEQGQRYYEYADGTPFFWLGDTHWQAFSNESTTLCNYPGCDCGSQFKHIVDDRVEKGFNIYQTYFVGSSHGGNGEPEMWLDAEHEQPNLAVFNDKADEMIAYLHERGMTVALGIGCNIFDPTQYELEDFLRLARYVVARYACYSVVWISGQEILNDTPGLTPGYTTTDYYVAASSLIEELDGYGHPNSAHMSCPVKATDPGAVLLDTTTWHDSWCLQGGHYNESRKTVGVIQSKNFYEGYYNAAGSGFVKPFVETESNYEEINMGIFTGYRANRIGAWRAVLCGSAGFTYGCNGIWASSFSTSDYTGWLGAFTSYSYEPWYMGLDKPGSFEMTYMREFFECIGPWYELVPQFKNKEMASFLDREQDLLALTEDKSLIVTYFYDHKTTTTGELYCLDTEKTYDAYWFNPRTGKFVVYEKGVTSADGNYVIPEKPDFDDWVFLLTAIGLGDHYEEDAFVDLNPTYEQVAPVGTPVVPADVSAVGGITYAGTPKDSQVMTDNTSWLYDGDPTTVWVPYANRVTQTFLFDLGTAQKLTHLTINTAENTIIPEFRVEGSNDGQHWRIITNTYIRDAENPGAYNEPLSGTYRYVKILLLNAKNKEPNANPTYKLVEHEQTILCNPAKYSATEIADIIIYSDGEGEATLERFVESTLIVAK